MDSPFAVTLYDKTFVRTAWLDDLDRIQVNPRHLAIGSAEFDVPTDYRFLVELTDPGARVTVDLDGEQILSGPIRGWSGKGPRAEGLMTFSVEDDARLMWNLFGYTTPANPVTSQPNKEDVRTGPAETVVKGLVGANVGRWGRPYTIAPDQGRGSTINLAIRMLPLTDKLLPLLDSAGIGVSVRQVDAGLVVDCYAPQLFPINLSEDGGTVIDYTLSKTGFSATRAIIGGPNEGTSREFKAYVNAALEAAYGDVIEIFVDASDQQLAADIIAKGKAAVDEAGPKYGFSITLDETSIFRYGGSDGISVGDRVAVQLSEDIDPITDVVREANLAFTREDGYTAELTVGDDQDNPDAWIASILDQLARGIRDLRTR